MKPVLALVASVALVLGGCLDLDDSHYRYDGAESASTDSGSGGGTGQSADAGPGKNDAGPVNDAGMSTRDAGTPVAGCLIITPNPIDLGTVKRNCSSASRTFTIYNLCAADRLVTLTGIDLSAAAGQPAGGPNCPGPLACPEYTLTQVPSLPTVMAAGGAGVTFQVKYEPIDLGRDEGEITVSTLEGPQILGYPVHLRGTGDEGGQQVDTFVQSSTVKADLLLVVDDSCSMADKQTNLANNFSTFLAYATTAHIDYQIGVTSTTELNDGGILCPLICSTSGSLAPGGQLYRNAAEGVPAILTSSAPNQAATFAKMVQLGTSGSSDERGLATATLALTEPNRSHANAGFVRSDANLAVVVVSDASDQSLQPVSYYLNILQNVKGLDHRAQFTFSNIGPYLSEAPLGCEYDVDHDPTRYASVVAATSGVSAEICSTDWSTTLTHLGDAVFGLRTQFFLTAVPDLSGNNSVTVRRNGAIQALSMTCPAATGAVVCFDAVSNSIQFLPASAPIGGDTVTVSYATGCF